MGPHRVVGRLVLGHTAPRIVLGGSRQVIMRTAPERCVSRLLGQAPTRISCRPWKMFEGLAGDVAFQAAHDLSVREPFGSATLDVVAGSRVATHAGQHDAVERGVGLAVTATVQAIPGGFA